LIKIQQLIRIGPSAFENVAWALYIFKILFQNLLMQLDLRFSYEDGTKVKRSRFLKDAGATSGSKTAHVHAQDKTNSDVKGRWILDLTKDPKCELTVYLLL